MSPLVDVEWNLSLNCQQQKGKRLSEPFHPQQRSTFPPKVDPPPPP